MAARVARGACFVLVLILVACGGGDSDKAASSGAAGPSSAGSSRPSGNGACGLMMQSEVDELFGTRVGAGVDETLDGGVSICSWPSGDEPSLLLQVSPGSSEIRAAVDLGDGYRVVDISEMSGPAAAAIEEADGPETVVVFAIIAGDKTITVSPFGLGIAADSSQFAELKALLDRVAARL